MAYANQNQGVFVPFHHQLIDPRNPPFPFFPRPMPVVLINPNPNDNRLHQLQMVPPPNSVPFVVPFSPADLARIDEERSRALFQFMADEGLLPSPEEEVKRQNVINKLRQIVMEWITRVAQQRKLGDQYIRSASATVLTYGSYGLRVYNSESDIDALCVGPCFATMEEDFFILLYSMLTSRPEVCDVHCIKDAKVPLMRFKLDGISIDLPYARLKVMYVPENVDILNHFFLRDIDEISWRSISGVHANNCILQLVPSLEAFQSLLRCVKLWAKRRGVYGNLLGFFGGVHLAILASFICQKHPNASLAGLISSFFRTFAFWPWPNPVILQDGLPQMDVIGAELRTLMPIRLPCKLHEYCHSNITKSTFYKIRSEFIRGHALSKDLLRPGFAWACLYEPFPYAKRYTRFVKICLSASDQEELGEWAGWVKSRFRNLLVKLEEILGFCDPNPTEYVDVYVSEPNIVFYWGLYPGRNNFLNMKTVREYFVKSLSNNYHGPVGKITLSIVQASQLPKNAQSHTECDSLLIDRAEKLDCNANPEYLS